MPPSQPVFECTCSDPAYFIIGLGFLFALSAAIYFLRRRQWLAVVLFGAWALYLPAITIYTTLKPDTVRITADVIEGRSHFSDFHIRGEELRRMDFHDGGKAGLSLAATVGDRHESTDIPIAYGRIPEFRAALTRFCAARQERLDWPEHLK